MAIVSGEWLSKEGLTYLWSKLKAIFTKQEETNVIVNAGAKNLFNINATPTKNHMTSALTDDTLTVTSNGNWANYNVPVNLPSGNYIFTASISNFSKDSSAGATSVRIRIAENTSGGTALALETVTGNGPMTIPFTWTGGRFYVQFYPNYSSTTTFVSTFTASNVMIRSAEITDATFQSYALPNPTLTPAAIKAVDEGAKNVIAFDAIGDTSNCGRSYTIKGVTMTLNSDGTISSSGTNDGTGDSGFWLYRNGGRITINEYCNGNYILSGSPSGGSTSTYFATAYANDYNYKDTGSGLSLVSYSGTNSIRYGITIKSGKSAAGLTFKPMICKKSEWDISQAYQPYAPTNRQLYDSMCRANVTLPSDADLDKIKTHGFYHGQGENITHRPVSGSYNFTLMVIESGEFIIQVFKQLNSAGDPYIFVRRFYVYNTSWDSWYQFSGTAV